MITTGAEPQKEMSKIQLEKAAPNGIGGMTSLMTDKVKHTNTVSLVRKKMRETYNHRMADMVSDYYKGGQKQNE